MVRIYLKNKDQPIDIEYSSIMKAFFLAWAGWLAIFGITLMILSYLISFTS